MGTGRQALGLIKFSFGSAVRFFCFRLKSRSSDWPFCFTAWRRRAHGPAKPRKETGELPPGAPDSRGLRAIYSQPADAGRIDRRDFDCSADFAPAHFIFALKAIYHFIHRGENGAIVGKVRFEWCQPVFFQTFATDPEYKRTAEHLIIEMIDDFRSSYRWFSTDIFERDTKFLERDLASVFPLDPECAEK